MLKRVTVFSSEAKKGGGEREAGLGSGLGVNHLQVLADRAVARIGVCGSRRGEGQKRRVWFSRP